MTLPTARHDLPASMYPFTIEALNAETAEVVWKHVVTGPGSVYVPPLARDFGHPIAIRVTWADGNVMVQAP